MKEHTIVCVVEGDGERVAVPILVNRILQRLRRHPRLRVDPDFVLCPRNGDCIVAPHNPQCQLGIEVFVGRAVREKPAAVLVIVDAEQRCVDRATNGLPPLGPELLARARAVAGEVPVGVVVANRMFETWFLADYHSLRDRGRFLADSRYPGWRTPEENGGCKGWMRDFLGRKYLETSDQAEFAKIVSLPVRAKLRERSPSFFKLYREVDRLSREAICQVHRPPSAT
ncbi:MAG: DUF4276 family protein [Polyangiaceae bacterium]|jgi:hypothetical protein|nr:DUF4276 family protein [Polyangiaceae bacterium]